jgi:hypothetical protein
MVTHYFVLAILCDSDSNALWLFVREMVRARNCGFVNLPDLTTTGGPSMAFAHFLQVRRPHSPTQSEILCDLNDRRACLVMRLC